ncbi:hypothetical protein ACFQ1T_03655 [Methylophilus glucosoxydans]|jgi:hypothetical protein|uniref:DUF1761 domain-containing protein n=1 Tax=Methylophilus glucosoxydans TaxID=752553 RepID=A0ABW3GEC8_9PROT|nr:hypothetical protein [Methylophilus sp. 13]MBF5039995.1 hypothetical protein [Methylophilus sp. 13]
MNVLLIGAVACITALILSAWLMTFARWFPIKGIDGEFLVDYKTMIRAHVDYALMALFGLGFYGAAKAAGIELHYFACVCVAIGGFTNPTVFVIAAFDPDFWNKTKWKVYSAISFVLTTIGFMTISWQLICHALGQ